MSKVARFPANYAKNVFINCPFDSQYQPLFHAIVFAVNEMGFRPRCAKDASNAGEPRFNKILNLIEECRYSIHDISRTEVDVASGLPRFNMPLELGLDLGCKRYGKPHHQEKVVLILDVDQHRYQGFISDIAGQDIEAHHSTERNAINAVRKLAEIGARSQGQYNSERNSNCAAIWDISGHSSNDLRKAQLGYSELSVL